MTDANVIVPPAVFGNNAKVRQPSYKKSCRQNSEISKDLSEKRAIPVYGDSTPDVKMANRLTEQSPTEQEVNIKLVSSVSMVNGEKHDHTEEGKQSYPNLSFGATTPVLPRIQGGNSSTKSDDQETEKLLSNKLYGSSGMTDKSVSGTSIASAVSSPSALSSKKKLAPDDTNSTDHSLGFALTSHMLVQNAEHQKPSTFPRSSNLCVTMQQQRGFDVIL